jgi:membrane protein required for colicin V production
MTVYDVMMIVLVSAGLIWGTVRGFSWGLASLSAIMIGYMSSHWASGSMLPVLSRILKCEPATQRGVSMLLTFGLVAGGCLLAAWKARATLRRMKFELYDRHLGGVLGGVEAALLGLIGTMFVADLAPDSRDAIFSGPTGRLAARLMHACGPAVPPEVREEIAPALRLASADDAPEAAPADDPTAETSAARTTTSEPDPDRSPTARTAPARSAFRSMVGSMMGSAAEPARPADVEERAVVESAPDPDGDAGVLRIGSPTRGWAPRRR